MDYRNRACQEKSNSSNVSAIKGWHSLRKKYAPKIIEYCLNLNFIGSKLNDLKLLLVELVKINK